MSFPRWNSAEPAVTKSLMTMSFVVKLLIEPPGEEKVVVAVSVGADMVDDAVMLVAVILVLEILEIDVLTADRLMVLINILLEMLLLSNVVMFPVTASMSWNTPVI